MSHSVSPHNVLHSTDYIPPPPPSPPTSSSTSPLLTTPYLLSPPPYHTSTSSLSHSTSSLPIVIPILTQTSPTPPSFPYHTYPPPPPHIHNPPSLHSSPMHLPWQDMHLKRQVVLLQQRKPLQPLGVGEKIVMGSLRVHHLVRVVVQHLSDASHPF